LIITAYGVKELFPKVIDLIEAAPKIDNWKFDAFIKHQTEVNDDCPYHFGNFKVNIKDLSFQPAKYIKSTGKIIINIYFDTKFSTTLVNPECTINKKTNKDLRPPIIFILEDLLGEELLYAKIKNFKLYKNNR